MHRSFTVEMKRNNSIHLSLPSLHRFEPARNAFREFLHEFNCLTFLVMHQHPPPIASFVSHSHHSHHSCQDDKNDEKNLLLLREFRSRASSGLSRSPRSSGIRFSADDPGVPHRSIYRHPGGDQPAVLSSSRLIAPGMYPYSEICSLIGSFMQSRHRGLPILFRRKRSHKP